MPPLRPVAPDPTTIKEILTIGAPVGATFFLETAVFAGIALLVSSLGDVAIAPPDRIQCLGHVLHSNARYRLFNGNPNGACIGSSGSAGVFMALKAGILCSGVISVTTMIILLSFPTTIVGIYSDSQDISLLAVRLLSFAALFVIIDAVKSWGLSPCEPIRKHGFPLSPVWLPTG